MKLTNLLERSPLWLQVQAKYELMPEKDRRALHLLTALLLVAAVYLLVWEPVTAWSESQKEEFAYQQSVHEWMEENIGPAKMAQKKQKTAAGKKDLSSVVSGSARQADLTLSRVQPDRKGLGVWIEDAAYQKLLAWMVALDTRYEVTIQQVKIDRGKDEGRVKVYMHLAN
ncbi:type II secretion system protein GspM [Endozoicomonas arenosclerae]|uniref:type II secretion system protein GspM n=1 Tax=Endozoicomonas arenosclerae TaxID=1633495 RepID=UPI00078474E5|nr:type II secretion system protein GspM [Endozoicomonas arenosclerae]